MELRWGSCQESSSLRLWKWYVTALGNLTKLPKTICNRFRQPLMEMVCNRLSSYLPYYAAAYGNGWQAVLPLMELRWGSCQESSSLRLWKWLASSSPIYGSGCNQQHTRQLLARHYRLAC